MPDSIPDYRQEAASLERRLRLLKRNIAGLLDIVDIESEDSASLLEAQLHESSKDWIEFQRLWHEREDFTPFLNDGFPNDTWLSIYDAARKAIIKANALLLQSKKKFNPIRPSEVTLPMNTTITTARPNLPSIPLPQYSGDLTRWCQFRDTFVSMVHEEPNLTKVEKFHYLLGALRGEALSLLSRIPIQDASYDLAWKRLLECYDNPRVLASMYIQRILDCQPKESLSEMKKYERFLTAVADSIDGFRNLQLKQPSEFLLSALALRALDDDIRRQFEISRSSSSEPPSADDVIKFIRQRLSALKISKDFSSAGSSQCTKVKTNSTFPKRNSHKYSASSSMNFHTASKGDQTSKGKGMFPRKSGSSSHEKRTSPSINKVICPLCQGYHILGHCAQFSQLSIAERTAFVKGWKGCRNCLRDEHTTGQCTSKWRCRFCKERHHSLIHENKDNSCSVPPSTTDNHPLPQTSSAFIGFGYSPTQATMKRTLLLGTVHFLIKGKSNASFPVRAVLDSGSQNTFISKSLASRTGLKLHPYPGRIKGLGGTAVCNPAGYTSVTICPYERSEQFPTNAIVVDSISQLPSEYISEDIVHKFTNLPLADPVFHIPRVVDMLIGIDLYPQLITGAPYHSGVSGLFLQPTVFGLAIIGSLEGKDSSGEGVALFTESREDIEESLKAFWEIEEPATVERQNPEDLMCEDHFLSTHSRTNEGRYMVKLPKAMSEDPVGTNRHLVATRFLNLEKKLGRDKELHESYKAFMSEYIHLGHMSPTDVKTPYLIPHHGVWQERSGRRKLRVVFDASFPSTSSSLNDTLMTGPKLQADLSAILIRFRMYSIPLCADLVKMYRQVLVHPEDRALQHILWRQEPFHAIQEYELNTVTYGMKPSAFLAMRVIKQLTIDEGSMYPMAVNRIMSSMYVDDIVTGADTVAEVIALKRELCELFAKGGFSLSKWASTIPEVLTDTTESMASLQVKSSDSEHLKILGLLWNPNDDSFTYSIISPPCLKVTKRIMLSAIARIFDPLGFLSPIILFVKVLLQEVWKGQLGWDELLPPEINNKWTAIVNEWAMMANIVIPRCIGQKDADYLLIGFCDASTKGYAASVYVRTVSPNGSCNVSIIKSKSKVAPLKYLSTARLELCGALLLARLMSSINISLLKKQNPICFSDSTVVLAWLKSPIHTLKTFEANRVTEILATLPPPCWRHVTSEDNPSDLASRGCLPSQLQNSSLWWHGPNWLSLPFDHWPKSIEVQEPSYVFTVTTSNKASIDWEDWASRFSRHRTLIRTMAYLIRFANNARSTSTKLFGPITAIEFHAAEERCVKLLQRHHFPKQLYSSQNDAPKEFRRLYPFVDSAGILRVGGRLQHALLRYEAKHLMLLPRSSHFTRLIIIDAHSRHYHAGPTLTSALTRGRFWIPGAMKLIRGLIHGCVEC